MKSSLCSDEIFGVPPQMKLNPPRPSPREAGFHREAISSTKGGFLPPAADLTEKSRLLTQSAFSLSKKPVFGSPCQGSCLRSRLRGSRKRHYSGLFSPSVFLLRKNPPSRLSPRSVLLLRRGVHRTPAPLPYSLPIYCFGIRRPSPKGRPTDTEAISLSSLLLLARSATQTKFFSA